MNDEYRTSETGKGLDGVWPSAKRNNAFCFFFWKKKDCIRSKVPGTSMIGYV
jgi:hypothetical protein